MNKHMRIGLVVALGVVAALPGFSGQVDLTIHPNGNLQNDVQATFPSGLQCSDAFGPHVCFNIGASDVNNFEFVSPEGDTFAANVFGATHVYLLLNASLSLNDHPFASVFLSGSTSNENVDLVTGTDARDFFQNNESKTINGTTTKNFYSIDNVSGHQAVGFPMITGNFRMDMIDIELGSLFLDQTLNSVSIIVNNKGNWGQPVVSAITVEATNTPSFAVVPISNPEPGTIAMALGGVALIWIGRKRSRR